LPGNFFIFGEGNLQKPFFEKFGDSLFLEDCSHLTPHEITEKIEYINNSPRSFGRGVGGEGFENTEQNKIYFFGWQSQSVIGDVLKISHFTLMPSRFLETFGLSALESLAEGVPVIGFRK
jgi:glycosyltransferase involved in cell wall biosynthesis